MSYNESDFQGEFGKWIKKPEQVVHFGTSNFELKITKRKSINPISDFQSHQLPELHNSKHRYVFHKHSDQSFDKKPWDCSLWVKEAGYVVILFYVPRAKKRFHVIDIDDFNLLIAQSTKPYLNETQIESVSQVFTL